MEDIQLDYFNSSDENMSDDVLTDSVGEMNAIILKNIQSYNFTKSVENNTLPFLNLLDISFLLSPKNNNNSIDTYIKNVTRDVKGRLQFSYKIKKERPMFKEQSSQPKVNINSKKLYFDQAKYTAWKENELNSSSHDRKFPASDNRLTYYVSKQSKPLLTRQFLKTAQRRTTLYSTRTTTIPTRVRNRMSRDNRREMQSYERKSHHKVQQRKDSISTSDLDNGYKSYSKNRLEEFEKEINNISPAASGSSTFAQPLPTYSNMHADPYTRIPEDVINQTLPGSVTNNNGYTRTIFSQHSRPSQHYPSLPIIQPLQQNMKPKQDQVSQLHQTGGRVQLSGSSSSPVEPIKPLLQLGGRGGGVLPQHPVFDEAAPKNLSGLTGSAAYLHCLVHNLANRSVST